MSFQQFTVNNNEAVGDFTDVARLDFADMNELITGNVAVQIATIPKGGGLEMSCVVTAVPTASVGDDLSVDVGTDIFGPDEFNAQISFVGGAEVADYNSGSDLSQGPAGNTTVIAGSLPVAIAVTADTPVYVFVDGTPDLTAGEVVIAMRITKPSRFSAVAT